MDTKSVIARFEAERQALAIMNHPNIARVLDAGATDAGRPFFVMELMHGIRIIRFCESLQHIMMAVSWGGHESLVMPKCAGISPNDFDSANNEHQYIRMYVGLEDANYLVKDIEQAISR